MTIDRATMRALADSGYMPLNHYVEERMMDIQKVREALVKLRDMGLCADGCNGRCKECPATIINEAIDALGDSPAPSASYGTDPTWEGPLAGDD